MAFARSTAKLLCAPFLQGALLLAVLWQPACAQGADDTLLPYAVNIHQTPMQSWGPGSGIYLGKGLFITAAHVAGRTWLTRPKIAIAGLGISDPCRQGRQFRGNGSHAAIGRGRASSGALATSAKLDLHRSAQAGTRGCDHCTGICRALPHPRARSAADRNPQPVQHGHRRCGSHRQFRIRGVRRQAQMPARNNEPKNIANV